MDLPEVSNDVKEGMSLKLWKVDFLKDFFRNCTISDFRQVRGAVECIVAFNSGETCVLNQLYGNMLEETFGTFCRVLNSN